MLVASMTLGKVVLRDRRWREPTATNMAQMETDCG